MAIAVKIIKKVANKTLILLLTIAVALCAFMLGLTVAGYTQLNADLPEPVSYTHLTLPTSDLV